jgi:predicted GNAT family acetyltransferase
MEHVLDNPAFNALISGNKNIANGIENVRYFNKNTGPFVGLKETSALNFKALHELIPDGGASVFISPIEVDLPEEWKTVNYLKCLQMIYINDAEQVSTDAEIVPLTDSHIPQMLALTKLTNPGPFLERTIDFGHYFGIFNGDKLIAMAGQRMHPLPYAEISAVCTHPDHLGKGYARQLLVFHANRIKTAGNIPFLHVRDDNKRAIKVYESLGFVTRAILHFYVIQKV